MNQSARNSTVSQSQLEIADGPVDGGSASSDAGSTTRRRLLQAGAGLAGMAGLPRGLGAPAIAQANVNLPRSPNIVVLMTDQERNHTHWPGGWAEKNLSSLQRLKHHGLSFRRAYTAACQCSPRARFDANGPLFAREPRNPDISLAWPGPQGPPAEHCFVAQGESRLRGGLERQMASELCLQRRDWQRWGRLASIGYRGDGEELGVVRLESAGRG